MPGVRTKGQVLIGCWCDEQFVKQIDAARHGLSRSQFCRDALNEKLASMGIRVDDERTRAPDRAGKGGRPTHQNYVMNEDRAVQNLPPAKPTTYLKRRRAIVAASSVAASQPVEGEAAADALAQSQISESGQKSGADGPNAKKRGPSLRKGAPSRGASRATKGPPNPPKPAPSLREL